MSIYGIVLLALFSGVSVLFFGAILLAPAYEYWKHHRISQDSLAAVGFLVLITSIPLVVCLGAATITDGSLESFVGTLASAGLMYRGVIEVSR